MAAIFYALFNFRGSQILDGYFPYQLNKRVALASARLALAALSTAIFNVIVQNRFLSSG
ncbi:MAG: hypothetical protein LBG47_08235 [Prevotellaceae bacterium]|jgi:hypothetical protein|nr:hypothetical protein [Prevotellaceae bacterium]